MHCTFSHWVGGNPGKASANRKVPDQEQSDQGLFVCSLEQLKSTKFVQRYIVIIFLPINKKMCFGCSKEPSHVDGSFEYPQHMFWLRNKKINFQLYTLIWGPGLEWSKLSTERFHFGNSPFEEFIVLIHTGYMLEPNLIANYNKICTSDWQKMMFLAAKLYILAIHHVIHFSKY